MKISLNKRNNTQLARLINEKLVIGMTSSIWVTIPMVHASSYSPLYDTTTSIAEDTWEWWNEFRISCNYDKHLGLILELPDMNHIPKQSVVDRWIGEPVKALIIPTSYFLINHHGKPVLSKVHQEIIQKFLSLDVQYIIKSDVDGDLSIYMKYLTFLGRKLYVRDLNTEFIQG